LLIFCIERGVHGQYDEVRWKIIAPFYLGVLLADLETRETPPLNFLRRDTYLAKLTKFVMFVLAILWSSEVCNWSMYDIFGII
jgi:hypothetical protein